MGCDKTEGKEVLPTYFECRKNGILYVRMVMPDALQKVTPKDERRVRVSMDTYDVEQAIIRGTPLIHATCTMRLVDRGVGLANKRAATLGLAAVNGHRNISSS